MTLKELRKLSRRDLLEMLLSLSKENEQLREQLQEARTQLESRKIEIENAGSLAEAALRLNGVFEAAQAACAQYEENLRLRVQEQEAQLAQKSASAEQQDSGYGKYSWLKELMNETDEQEGL